MRRVISFLLILVFCLSLACPAFAHRQSPNGPAPGPNRPDRWYPSILGDNPKTGDIIMFWVAVMLVSVLALGAVYFLYRKKFCN